MCLRGSRSSIFHHLVYSTHSPAVSEGSVPELRSTDIAYYYFHLVHKHVQIMYMYIMHLRLYYMYSIIDPAY